MHVPLLVSMLSDFRRRSFGNAVLYTIGLVVVLPIYTRSFICFRLHNGLWNPRLRCFTLIVEDI
jgi:hypothetical protein